MDSNKSPNKSSEVKVEVKKSEAPTMSKKKSLWPEENMSSWEYYNHIMRFGKRKMVRQEWVVWKMKKDEEDLNKKGYVGERKKASIKERNEFYEYAWRLKKDPDFIDTIARGEFSLDFNKKNGAWY